MDYKEKSIMTDLLVQNQALRNAANGFKARCEELEAKNRRLEEARENANAACAKWEGLYKAEVTKRETLEKMVKEYQEVIIPGYRNIAEKSGGMPMPEQQKAKEGMRMERITSNRTWEEAQYNLANEKGYSSIWLRLNMIEDILGEDYDLERLRELVEADRDGRCVVLLRKPYYKLYSGEEIYIVEDGEVYMDHVQEVDLSESDHEKNKVEAWYYTGNDFAFTEREWGKTVFQTSEAAEAALKGEGNP